MNDLIYWLLMALIQLIIYLLPSIPLKGKWIRKKDTAAASSMLGDAVVPEKIKIKGGEPNEFLEQYKSKISENRA